MYNVVSSYELVSVDAGNRNIKIFGERGELLLPSELGEARELKAKNFFKDTDIIYEYQGEKGFAGTLARDESEYVRTKLGDTKAHKEFLKRVLIALAVYTEKEHIKLIVGQPIGKHIKSEKEKMIKMLKGEHEITINSNTRKFYIDEVYVALEGGSAFWSNPIAGNVHVLDFGSGTVNGATLVDGHYIDKKSFTLSYGLEDSMSNDYASLVKSVIMKCQNKKWNTDSLVYVVGEAAEKMLTYLQNDFAYAEVLYPKIRPQDENCHECLMPVFANAIGFFEILKSLEVEQVNK